MGCIGELLASVGSGYDGQVIIWNWEQGLPLVKQRAQVDLTGVAFTPDSKKIVTTGKEHFKVCPCNNQVSAEMMKVSDPHCFPWLDSVMGATIRASWSSNPLDPWGSGIAAKTCNEWNHEEYDLCGRQIHRWKGNRWCLCCHTKRHPVFDVGNESSRGQADQLERVFLHSVFTNCSFSPHSNPCLTHRLQWLLALLFQTREWPVHAAAVLLSCTHLRTWHFWHNCHFQKCLIRVSVSLKLFQGLCTLCTVWCFPYGMSLFCSGFDQNSIHSIGEKNYPDAVACAFHQSGDVLCTIYSNRTTIFWGVKDKSQVELITISLYSLIGRCLTLATKSQGFLHHRFEA